MILLLIFLGLAMSIFIIALIHRTSPINKIYRNFVLVLNIIQISCIILILMLLVVLNILLETNQSIPFLENDKVFVPFLLVLIFVLIITFIANVIYFLFHFLKWRKRNTNNTENTKKEV